MLLPALFATAHAIEPQPVQQAGRASITIAEGPVQGFSKPPKRQHSITVSIPARADGIKLPPISGPKDPARPLIVIDPGHGGHDPGAVNAEEGYREKDITLALAKALRDQLIKDGRLRVALTRDDDRYLVLQERSDIARRMGADLFISLHADAADSDTAQGATIYTLSETASDREAARLAARENKADILNGINLGEQSGSVSSILIDLSQRESMAHSTDFAKLLYRIAAPYVKFRPTYHRFASLVVLKSPDTPSVLFEAGYITSAADAVKLGSAEGRDKIAQGVARAIEVYFARQAARN